MLPRRLADGMQAFVPIAGGAIFNTAIALGRLGADAGFFSGLSNDMFADVLRKSLDESGVDYSLCINSSRPTTLAFVKLTDGDAQYQFYDNGSAGRMITVSDLPKLPATVSALHFGAISLIPEPCGHAFETLALREAPSRVISLDPNIRPGFIDDEDAHRARVARMTAVADIIKVSDEDIDWLAPDVSHEKTISRWLAGGASVIALTRGGKGVRLFTADRSIDIPAKPANVVDTVGAGDTFNAGFLCGLAQSGLMEKNRLRKAEVQELRTAAELAVEAAAITVSRAGANPPWKTELGKNGLGKG